MPDGARRLDCPYPPAPNARRCGSGWHRPARHRARRSRILHTESAHSAGRTQLRRRFRSPTTTDKPNGNPALATIAIARRPTRSLQATRKSRGNDRDARVGNRRACLDHLQKQRGACARNGSDDARQRKHCAYDRPYDAGCAYRAEQRRDSDVGNRSR